MKWQTFDLQFVQSVTLQAEKIVNVISHSNSYTLYVKDEFSEANVLIPESLLSVTSMIMTSQHDSLHTWLKSSSILNSESAAESVSFERLKDCVKQHCLSVPNSAA